MKIIQKIRSKAENPHQADPVTLAFLGDSVTQGCFEIYKNDSNSIETVFDISSAYHTYVRDILCQLYPRAPINIINAGISGSDAPRGAIRLERDVLRFSPDLVVVAFGLNDSVHGMDGVEMYRNAMSDICSRLVSQGIEVIVMTTNMMRTKHDFNEQDADFSSVSDNCCERQNEGILDAYMDAAREVAEKYSCKLCDCYKNGKPFMNMVSTPTCCSLTVSTIPLGR